MTAETEIQVRLRRAKESLESARDAEDSLRKALADAVRRTATMKEKYSELFQKDQQEEYRRRLERYAHCTK